MYRRFADCKEINVEQYLRFHLKMFNVRNEKTMSEQMESGAATRRKKRMLFLWTIKCIELRNVSSVIMAILHEHIHTLSNLEKCSSKILIRFNRIGWWCWRQRNASIEGNSISCNAWWCKSVNRIFILMYGKDLHICESKVISIQFHVTFIIEKHHIRLFMLNKWRWLHHLN